MSPSDVRVLDRRLDGQRRPDREEEAGDVERGEDRDPAERPDRVEAEHPAQEQRLGRAHVAVGEGDRLDLPQLFDQAVRHSLASVGGGCKPPTGGQCSGLRGRSLTVGAPAAGTRRRSRRPARRAEGSCPRGCAGAPRSRFPRRSARVDERLAVVERNRRAGVGVGEQEGERVPAGREARAFGPSRRRATASPAAAGVGRRSSRLATLTPRGRRLAGPVARVAPVTKVPLAGSVRSSLQRPIAMNAGP